MLWRTGRPGKRPGIIEPCIPTVVSKPPAGPQWIHEIKHDGYRLIARKRDGGVGLFTRRGYDWTERYPRISAAVAGLRTASATIDGEAVWCDGAGIAVFDKLRSPAHDTEVILYAFDLLELDGEDWRPRPLDERKARLEKVLAKIPPGVRFTESTSKVTVPPSSPTPASLALRASSPNIASIPTEEGRAGPGSRSRILTRLACCVSRIPADAPTEPGAVPPDPRALGAADTEAFTSAVGKPRRATCQPSREAA